MIYILHALIMHGHLIMIKTSSSGEVIQNWTINLEITYTRNSKISVYI